MQKIRRPLAALAVSIALIIPATPAMAAQADHAAFTGAQTVASPNGITDPAICRFLGICPAR